MPGFGRLHSPDPRDAQFPFSLAAQAPARAWRYWIPGPILDQDGLPQCVAYAWKGWLLGSPIRQGGFLDPAQLYRQAQLVDEWPGEGYDGTSVRAGAKVLQGMGFVGSYLWASSVEEVKSWILATSPVVLGTNWYESMMNIDSAGFVKADGALVGGHAWLAYGFSNSKQAFRCLNSWGASWGQKGKFWLRAEDMSRLLGESGEACTATEEPVVPG